jgi:nitrogen regulatory protein PII
MDLARLPGAIICTEGKSMDKISVIVKPEHAKALEEALERKTVGAAISDEAVGLTLDRKIAEEIQESIAFALN